MAFAGNHLTMEIEDRPPFLEIGDRQKSGRQKSGRQKSGTDHLFHFRSPENVVCPLFLPTGATLKPGSSPGTLTINGDLALNGTLRIELFSPTSFDILNVTGQVSFGQFSLIDFLFDYTPSSGDTFTFLYAGSFGSHQVSYTIAGLPSGFNSELRWTPSSLALVLEQAQASVPEPGSLPLLLLGLSSLALAGRWRKPGQEVCLR